MNLAAAAPGGSKGVCWGGRYVVLLDSAAVSWCNCGFLFDKHAIHVAYYQLHIATGLEVGDVSMFWAEQQQHGGSSQLSTAPAQVQAHPLNQ
jgi:hypothetical protein